MAQVVLAKEAGICYASVAMATDYDCWRDHGESVSVTDVLATFKKNAEKVTAMLKEVVPFIGSQGHWDDVIDKLKVFQNNIFFLEFANNYVVLGHGGMQHYEAKPLRTKNLTLKNYHGGHKSFKVQLKF
jgi:hypothetical protein